jgi:prepilin-type N-terminal cleavage/methylation domain-containing protein
MKTPNKSDTSHAAFTVVELLVVIVIIAVLATVLFSLTRSMRSKASSATSAANLRQVATGIVAHASDRNGTLPGPVLTDHFPRYQDNALSGQLGWLLKEYFSSIPQPDASQPRMFYTPELDYPSAKSGAKNGKNSAKPTYVVFAKQTDPVTGSTFWPMGNYNPNSSGNRTPPMTMTQIAARNTRGNHWITEIDQIIRPSTSRYGSEEKPPHGSFRNTLMFDFSVKAVPLADFEAK